MLDDAALSQMDANGLREYIRLLHEAMAHIITSAGEGYSHVKNGTTNGTGETDGKSTYLDELARGLSGGARRT